MKAKKVVLHGYYNLDGSYLVFEENEHHGKTYSDVNVEISEETRTVAGIDFAVDIISIEGCEPIECELVSCKEKADGTMVISLCQDWG